MGFLKDLVIKLGLDSSGVDKGVKGAGNSLNNLKGMVGKVGAAMGIAFAPIEINSFPKFINSLTPKAIPIAAPTFPTMPLRLFKLLPAPLTPLSTPELSRPNFITKSFRNPIYPTALI